MASLYVNFASIVFIFNQIYVYIEYKCKTYKFMYH